MDTAANSDKLFIPDIPDGTDTLTAALLYAAAGWYVLPVKKGTNKHPGSVVGVKWQDKSSRDPKQVAAWFAGTDYGLALHMGRSGGLAFDIDYPDKAPEILARHLDSPPYQSSRPDTPGRGHYVFRMPPGMNLGNSTGRLGRNWGQVRGRNGVIVAEPSWGKYHWKRVGIVPDLPQELVDLLPDFSGPDSDAATDGDVSRFMLDHCDDGSPGLVSAVVRQLKERIKKGESRHESALSVMTWAMEEAAAGLYSAAYAANLLKPVFITSLAQPKNSSDRVVRGDQAESEWSGIRAWAVGRALAKTEEEREAIRRKAPHRMMESEDKEFWTQTTQLEHVFNYARAQQVSPYATLGAVLRGAAASIEPNVVLPAKIGTYASLNLFTVPVGTSGRGKDAANAVARDCCRFITKHNYPRETDLVSPGSGEGLARIFSGYHTKDGPVGARTRAILEVPDIATLEALADRKGQSLVGQLLHAFMGQPLGFNNAQRETTTAVAAHKYRLCLSVGVQPENASFFLTREKDGLPQRFLWLPTIDRFAPQTPPEPIEPMDFPLPHFSAAPDVQHVMTIPEEVSDEIRQNRWLVLTGSDEVDPLDSHLKLTQLKTAAAFAILHGSTEVELIHWEMAGHLIDISRQVRSELAAAVAARGKQEAAARAHSQADREIIVSTRLTEEYEKRVRQSILNRLDRVDTAKRSDLRGNCRPELRPYFDPVFDRMLDEEELIRIATAEGHADMYRRGQNRG